MAGRGAPSVSFWDALRPPKDGFIEVCGLSGSGKTQLLLDACCRAVLSSRTPAVFIDTEGTFSARRFQEVVVASTSTGAAATRLLERLQVYRTFDALELQSTVCDLLDAVRDRPEAPPFSALFVDSIAFPFRGDPRRLKECVAPPAFGHEALRCTGPPGSLDRRVKRDAWDGERELSAEARRRQSLALADLGSCLREIARRGVAVVLTNHLRETPEGLAPALPRQWTKLAARRLLVERLHGAQCYQLSVLAASEGAGPMESIALGFRIGVAGVQADDEVSEAGGSDGEGSEGGNFGARGFCDDSSSASGGEEAGASSGHEEDLEEDSDLEGVTNPSAVVRPAIACQKEGDQELHVWPPAWWVSRPSVQPKAAAALLGHGRARLPGPLAEALNLGGLLWPEVGAPSWPGGALEVCGEAGTGKTQFCLSCVAAAALSCSMAVIVGPRGPCILYLHSERAPVLRLRQVLEARVRAAGLAGRGATDDMDEALDSVFMEHVADPAQLYAYLSRTLPQLLRHASLHLIVLDSAAALFRSADSGLAGRSAQLFRTAMLLQRVAEEYGVPIVVTNHVTSEFADGDGRASDWVKPALGHAWSACVTHRVSLHRADRSRMRWSHGDLGVAPVPGCGARAVGAVSRFARLEFSPVRPPAVASFKIGPGGIE